MLTMENYSRASEKVVIATIHQPSSQIFHLFTNLLLIVEGQVLSASLISGEGVHMPGENFPKGEFRSFRRNWNHMLAESAVRMYLLTELAEIILTVVYADQNVLMPDLV